MDSFEIAFKNVSDSFEKTSLLQLEQTLRSNTTHLYSSIINLSQQKKKGEINKLLTKDNEEYEDLKIIKRIGKGGFSEVFQAINPTTNKEFALRLCQVTPKTFNHQRALKEISIYNQLKLIDHPNIAKVFTAKIISSASDNQEESLSLQVIMELGMCTLEDVFRKRVIEKKPWTQVELLKIFAMLTDAMRVARQYGISHRDLSLNNVILGGDLKDYKLIDFGEAKTISDKVESIPIVGKLAYLPPEIKLLVEQLEEDKDNVTIDYDPEMADVYSMGIIFASLCILDKFDSRDSQEEWSRKLSILQDQYPKLYPLILDMVNDSPGKRKSFEEVLNAIQILSPGLGKIHFFEMEFESGLQSTKKMRQTNGSFGKNEEESEYETEYKQRIAQGDFSMRNNLFGEAILNYVKVYEIYKRGELHMSKE